MPNRVISFHFTLTDPAGQTLASSKGMQPLTFMEGVGQVIPSLEAGLQNLKVGDKKKIEIPSDDAFGPRDEKRVVQVPLEKLPAKGIKIGDQFQIGQQHDSFPMTVIDINDKDAILDGNHPLAGIDLTFDVEIAEIRDATQEELDHGHAHGAGDHHH